MNHAWTRCAEPIHEDGDDICVNVAVRVLPDPEKVEDAGSDEEPALTVAREAVLND